MFLFIRNDANHKNSLRFYSYISDQFVPFLRSMAPILNNFLINIERMRLKFFLVFFFHNRIDLPDTFVLGLPPIRIQFALNIPFAIQSIDSYFIHFVFITSMEYFMRFNTRAEPVNKNKKEKTKSNGIVVCSHVYLHPSFLCCAML